MKDPMNGWYMRGWQRVSENGKTRFEYIGEYYSYGLQDKALRQMKLRLAGFCTLFSVTYLLSALLVSDGAMWRWVGLFHILTLLSGIYLCMAVGRICLSGQKMTYRDYHAGPLRLKKAATACVFLTALSLAAELVYIIVYPCSVGRELIFVAELAICLLIAAEFVRFGKRCPCEMTEGTKEV